METSGTIAGAVGAMGEVEAQLAAARATIEQHEERAHVHAEERAAHYAEMARVTGERDEAVAVVAGLRQEIGDAADTLHGLSLAQQRLARAGDRGAWATSGAYARAAQIVAGIGDPAARAATGAS